MTTDEIKQLMGKSYRRYCCHPKNFVQPFGHPPDKRMGTNLFALFDRIRTELEAESDKPKSTVTAMTKRGKA